MSEWPRVELDAVSRLRALSRALPHTILRERVIDAPFEDVWAIAGDMERGTPLMEFGIRAVDILERDDDRLRLRTHSNLGATLDLDAILRPGWCVMRSPSFDIGMAAIPVEEGRRTLFAHYEGMRGVGRLLRPLLWGKIGGDFRRLTRHARLRGR
jgi:hypothetical protein